MQVFRGIEGVERPEHGVVLVLGNFDGVHVGHQALIRLCRERADALGVPGWGVTFDPHPSRVLAPELAPPLICSLDRRLELMGEAGCDAVLVLRFSRAFASLSPEAFVDQYLVQAGAREVVAGYDFSFGKGRQGSPEVLARLGGERGFAVHVVPPVRIPSGLVPSSSKIREFVLEGRMDAAERLLGRPFEVEGVVQPGAGRGTGLGFPTANLHPEGELWPRGGVYAVEVLLEGETRRRPGAANVGSNPTFSEGEAVHVEVHVMGWVGGSLHGRRLRAGFVERLRPERRFPSVEVLKLQMDRDVVQAERILAARGVPR